MPTTMPGGLSQVGDQPSGNAPSSSQNANQPPTNNPPPFSVLPIPPWQATRRRSLSSSHAELSPQSQPQSLPTAPGFSAVQWPATSNPPNPPARPSSPQPPTNPQQPSQHFHYPPANRSMPGPKELAAPHFDGTPEDLKEFLEEIEVRGRDNNLGSRDHILHAIRYVSGSERALWRKHAAVIGSDWNRFKARMMSLYPGSDDSSANTVTELEVLVETQASILVTDIRQFGMYHRKYTVIADALLARGKISLRERSKLFLAGLHIDFRNQVRTQLRLLDPTHPIDEPYTITQMEEAAKFLLEGKGGQAPFALPSLTATQSSHPAVPAASAPRETFDMTAMQQLMTSLTAANTKMMSEFMAEMRNQQNTVASSFTQQSRPFNPQFSTQSGCRACSDPSHFIRYCPKVTEYIRQGRCIRDQTNRICLPNGVLVTPRLASGKDILERVDNWHSANPTTANNTSASIVQTNTFEAVPSSSPSPSASATATSQFHATTSPDNELQVLDAVTVAALRRQDEIRAHSKTSGKSKVNPTNPKNSSTTPPTTVQPSQSTNSQSASSSQPQYRYSTPIEDPAITQNVIQRSLDTPFPITLRELYSTSPDVRKLIKDQITTRRIPVGQTATVTVEDVPEENDPAISSFIHQHSHRSNSIIVANQTEDLRTITLELDGKVSVNAILDEGSQITAIRRDIWEKLGLPLLSNEKMIMESANSSREATMGLLRDLPARIGRSTFYLQVQVVENASYEMLLGRPFLTLTEARTHHYTNGDSHLTLLDPNSHDTFTIPTKPRVHPENRVAKSGF